MKIDAKLSGRRVELDCQKLSGRRVALDCQKLS